MSETPVPVGFLMFLMFMFGALTAALVLVMCEMRRRR